jgi:hypothetical protein
VASARQIAANRRNAQKCTGPKTEEGKRASRMNALRHGMSARTLVLPYEDEIEYHELRAKLIEGYQPANNQELMLVDQIAAGYWRTARARAYERDMLAGQVATRKLDNGLSPAPDPDRDDYAGAVVLTKEPKASFDNYFRYDASIERALYRAINALEKIQSRRIREERLSQRRVPEMGLVSFRTADASLPLTTPASQPAVEAVAAEVPANAEVPAGAPAPPTQSPVAAVARPDARGQITSKVTAPFRSVFARINSDGVCGKGFSQTADKSN